MLYFWHNVIVPILRKLDRELTMAVLSGWWYIGFAFYFSCVYVMLNSHWFYLLIILYFIWFGVKQYVKAQKKGVDIFKYVV